MLFCVAAGVQLLGIQPAQENSIFGMIAHGLGLYCIGKGLYCAGDLWPRQAVSPALPVATTPRRLPISTHGRAASPSCVSGR